MLSDDDMNLSELTDEELVRAWDLWFDLAQATNEWDPPYSHGVFAGVEVAPAPTSMFQALRAITGVPGATSSGD